MNKTRIGKCIDGLEREYKNFVGSYFRMMSYNSKVNKIIELDGDDSKRIAVIKEKMIKKSEQIYKSLHAEKEQE